MPAKVNIYRINEGAKWNNKDRIWILKDTKIDSKLLPNYMPAYFAVQKSPSGIAVCRICGKCIPKGAIRACYPIRDSRGEYGALAAWVHQECSNILVQSLYYDYKEKHENEAEQVVSNRSCDTIETFVHYYGAGFTDLTNDEQNEYIRSVKTEIPNNTPDNDYIETSNKVIEKVEIPKELNCSLLPFQIEGVSWMVAQEKLQRVLGGILADEMGMGKTIQTIALLLINRVYGCKGPNGDVNVKDFEYARNRAQNYHKCLVNKAEGSLTDYIILSDKDFEEIDANYNNDQPKGATLVVTPTAALLQWQTELARFAPNLKVTIYQGTRRESNVSEFVTSDVILTTYNCIEIDYRKIMNKYKVACSYCGKLFLPSKLRLHLKYFCGDNAMKTEKQSKQKKKQIKFDPSIATPTLSNIYREILVKAGRDDLEIDWYNRGKSKNNMISNETTIDSNTLSSPEVDTNQSNNAAEEASMHSNSVDSEPITFKLKERKLSRTKKTEIDKTKTLQKKKSQNTSNENTSLPSVELMVETIKNDFEIKKIRNSRQSRKSKENLLKNLKSIVIADEAEYLTDPETSEINDINDNSSVSSDMLEITSDFEEIDTELFTQSQANTTDSYIYNDEQMKTIEIIESIHNMKKVNLRDLKKYAEILKIEVTSENEKYKNPVKGDYIMALEKFLENNAKQKGNKLGQNKTEEHLEINMDESPLHSIAWQRIILDEAHRIKSLNANMSKSAMALKCIGTKWCITGTPLQNRVDELYALLKFLEFYPYAYYFCGKKKCTCCSLHYEFDEKAYCIKCGHTKMSHYSFFQRTIAKPVISYGSIGEGLVALNLLRNDILSFVMLRRTKDERKSDINLPPLKITIIKKALKDAEQDFYNALYTNSKTKFDTYVNKDIILNNFAHIFDLLSRLRQATNHPYLIVHSNLNKQTMPTRSKNLKSFNCGICFESIDFTNIAYSKCKHFFHSTCIEEYIDTIDCELNIACPVCMDPITLVDIENTDFIQKFESAKTMKVSKKSMIHKINVDEFESSTKINLLIDCILKTNEDDKSIVFSQYTAFLELIEFALKKANITCVLYTGSLTVQARQTILREFNLSKSLKCILVSLKAGGEGLNLQIANNIFIMDPWWNPAAEMQAIQRAHRIGQKKPVNAMRIIAEGTIEERILQLQDKKQLVFEGTIGNQVSAFQKLTADDLKFLFQ